MRNRHKGKNMRRRRKKVMKAASYALAGRLGRGHYGTKRSYLAKLKPFAEFVAARGLFVDEVDKAVVQAYADHVKGRVERLEIKVNYAQNLLSVLNCYLAAMRGNDDLSVKPADVVGRRRFVRLVPPLGMYRAAVRGMSAELRGDGWGRESAIVDVIEAGGLRVHEGSLLNFRFALRQARRRRCFLVKRGSKGGRAKYIRRLVPVDDVMLDALERGAALQGDRDNLIPEEMTAHQFEQRLRRVWRRYRAKYGLGTPKDLRSAFACRYYEARTGNPAPCLTAGVTASKHADLEARIAVSLILGHSRIDVVAQYVGTRRRAKRENDDG